MTVVNVSIYTTECCCLHWSVLSHWCGYDAERAVVDLDALLRPDAAEWWAATVDEWQSFIDMEVFEEVDLPAGRRAIQSKLVYKLKRDEFGIPVRHKARIVALGFQQALLIGCRLLKK
eukprot:2834498-Rhodomonas_salina.1